MSRGKGQKSSRMPKRIWFTGQARGGLGGRHETPTTDLCLKVG